MTGAGRRRAAAWGALLALSAPALAAQPPPVTVQFQGEIGSQWEIEPSARSITVARGEVFETRIGVRNRSAREVVAMVVNEIRPQEAAGALIHLGCGPTFTLILKPGEASAVLTSYFVAEGAPAEVARFEIAYAVYSFEPYNPEPLQVGRRIYAERCVNCHGPLARGDGPTARLLSGGVGDLMPALQRKEERILLQAIASGMGPMPAFTPALTLDEQQAVLLYLHGLGAGSQ